MGIEQSPENETNGTVEHPNINAAQTCPYFSFFLNISEIIKYLFARSAVVVDCLLHFLVPDIIRHRIL